MNQGASWEPFSSGLTSAAVHDLVIQKYKRLEEKESKTLKDLNDVFDEENVFFGK